MTCSRNSSSTGTKAGDSGRRSLSAAAVLAAVATAAVLFGGMSGKESANVELIFAAQPDTVIERLVGGLKLSSANLRVALQASQSDAGQATATAQTAFEAFSRSGNARYLGIAKTALTPWLEQPEPPADIWLLRARLAQTEHRFAEAAADIDAMTQAHPESTAGMLLAADAWRRAGRIDEARQACVRVALRGRPGLARVCSAEVLLSLGQYEDALTTVAEFLPLAGTLPLEERRWVNAVYTDTLIANGNLTAAADALSSDTSVDDLALATVLTHADVLSALSQSGKVIELLDGYPAGAAVLLRRAAAFRRAGLVATAEQNYEQLRDRLQAIFAAEELAGTGDLHLRERSLAALQLDDDPEHALKLALDNWALQKSWEDADLVLMTARHAGRPSAAQPVVQWRRGWSDQELPGGEIG